MFITLDVRDSHVSNVLDASAKTVAQASVANLLESGTFQKFYQVSYKITKLPNLSKFSDPVEEIANAFDELVAKSNRTKKRYKRAIHHQRRLTQLVSSKLDFNSDVFCSFSTTRKFKKYVQLLDRLTVNWKELEMHRVQQRKLTLN